MRSLGKLVTNDGFDVFSFTEADTEHMLSIVFSTNWISLSMDYIQLAN